VLIYMAGAIDRADKNGAWRKELQSTIFRQWDPTCGCVTLYNPYEAFKLTGVPLINRMDAEAIVAINKQALSRADIVMVHYTPLVETWGTAIETFEAFELGTPVIVWTSNKAAFGADDLEDITPAFLPVYLLAHAWKGRCFVGAKAAVREISKAISKRKANKPTDRLRFRLAHKVRRTT